MSSRKTYKELGGSNPQEREAWIETACKSELLEVLKACEPHVPEYKLAEKMLLIRLAEPHWALGPSFWVAVAAMVFAAIAAWPVVQAWLRI